jgi:hypothetical protein
VRILLGAGAEVNTAADDGETALFAASCNGHDAIVRTLIEAGAEVNRATDDAGVATPLFIAARDGHLAVVRTLIEARARANNIAGDGVTPVFAAAHGSPGAPERVAPVEASGGAIPDAIHNATDFGGQPVAALHAAAARGHLEIVRYLVEHAGVSRATGLRRGTIAPAGMRAPIDLAADHPAVQQFLAVRTARSEAKTPTPPAAGASPDHQEAAVEQDEPEADPMDPAALVPTLRAWWDPAIAATRIDQEALEWLAARKITPHQLTVHAANEADWLGFVKFHLDPPPHTRAFLIGVFRVVRHQATRQ